MDDFPGLLARDFGFKSHGKAAPMAATKNTSAGGNLNFGIGSGGDGGRSNSFSSTNQRGGKSNWNSTPAGNSFLDDDNLFRPAGNQKMHDFDGLGGGYNDVFGGPPKYGKQPDARKTSTSFDYDSIFQQGAGGGGNKSSTGGGGTKSASPVYDKPVYDDDIFDGVPGMKSTSSVNYDDVFATISSPPKQNDHYDDLLGNFGKSEQSKSSSSKRPEKVNRDASDFDDLIPGFGGSSPPKKRGTPVTSQPRPSTIPSNRSTNVMEDVFVDLQPSSAPAYESRKIFPDETEQINNAKKPDMKFNGSSSGVFDDLNPLDDLAKPASTFSSGPRTRVDARSPSRTGIHTTPTHKAAFDEPTEDSFFKTSTSASPKVDMSPTSEVNLGPADDIWITVSEVPLFTQPTRAPPPSRPPPPRPVQVSKSRHTTEKVNEYSSFPTSSPSPTSVPSTGVGVSSIDELEDFVRGTSRDHSDARVDVLSSDDEPDTNSAAAAMKEAMDKAELKFKHAKEVRERENARNGRNREASEQEKDERALRDAQEREMRERKERLDREREQQEQREKEERRRREKERERQAVERATKEARERAAAEARQRAVAEKNLADARTRERAAVQKLQAEARERAAAEAKGRAERAAAEAKERAEREARERSNAEARRRKAEAESQQKNENDLESFFNMGTRPSSAPRPNRTSNSDSSFPSQFQTTQSGKPSPIRKTSSTTNIADDLSSIFGGPSSSGEFQDIDGESEERRRARLERHQRTHQRAQQALAEKNERDRQAQNEQAERHRFAETLDFEIKRWSAGKEGNLRALLSTLQYVLWPECGWQPVSLTDLITGASVKKVYRKATLCIHPDKVQQKGANLQQKYIAEKVFDLLKEAWNKFNSEELF